MIYCVKPIPERIRVRGEFASFRQMTASSPPKALRDHTTLRLGGTPERWYVVQTLEQLGEALRQSASSKVLVLGGGSNVVCSDAAFDGVVIEVALKGLHVAAQAPLTFTALPLSLSNANTSLDAVALPADVATDVSHVWLHIAAGERWDAVVEAACRWDLGGIECLSGIPGNAGATPIQNVGAYGQEIADTLYAVTCVERASGRLVTFSAEECALSYRNSRFKAADVDKYVVVEVVLQLSRGVPGALRYGELVQKFPGHSSPSIAQVRQVVLKTRAAKSMLLDPKDPNGRNCGSFFMNPVVSRSELERVQSAVSELVPYFDVDEARVKIPAAWLIERAGFARGQRQGNVGLSSKHTLCLVAHDNATAVELLCFARTMRDTVKQRFGVELRPEPVLIGLTW